MKRAIVTGALLLGFLVGVAYAQSVVVEVTIPQAIAPDVVQAFALRFNYNENVPNPNYCPQEQFDDGLCAPLDPNEWIANPEGKAAFAKRMVKEFIAVTYVDYMGSEAATVAGEAAREQAEVDADTITVQ